MGEQKKFFQITTNKSINQSNSFQLKIKSDCEICKFSILIKNPFKSIMLQTKNKVDIFEEKKNDYLSIRPLS